MMAVPVKTGSNFDPGTPMVLFQANPREMLATSEQFSYEVSAGRAEIPYQHAPEDDHHTSFCRPELEREAEVISTVGPRSE